MLLTLGVQIVALVFLELLELVGVGRADELAIHVENLALRIHEELSVIALNLNSTHDHVVFHVNGHLFVVFGRLHIGLRLVLEVLLVGVRVFELVLVIVVDVHIRLLAVLPWVAPLPAQTAARVVLCVHLIVVFVSELQGVTAVLGLLVLVVVGLLQGLVLEIHWIVSLVIQEPLSLEEILAPLESTLLLHLLEAVLVRLQDFLS